MEDICNELFGLGGSGDQAAADSTAGASSSGQQQTNDEFFKTLSFYDEDDDPLDLPFESLFDSSNVPTECRQPNQAPDPSLDH